MKKIYCLSTCDTCRRVLKALQPGPGVELSDIKKTPISPEELDELKSLAGSYETLFSRKAVKYREMNLAAQALGEADIRRLILEEYTFLRRPLVRVGDQVFIGSQPQTVAAAAEALHKA